MRYIILKKQKKRVNGPDLSSNLYELSNEIKTREQNEENEILLVKADAEHFNYLMYDMKMIPDDEYLEYMEKKNYENFKDLETFLRENESFSFPVLPIFKRLGLSDRVIFTNLPKIKCSHKVTSKNFMETKEYREVYDDYRYYAENKEVQHTFARLLWNNKVIPYKVYILTSISIPDFSRITIERTMKTKAKYRKYKEKKEQQLRENKEKD